MICVYFYFHIQIFCESCLDLWKVYCSQFFFNNNLFRYFCVAHTLEFKLILNWKYHNNGSCQTNEMFLWIFLTHTAEFGHFDSSRHNVDFYKGYVLLPKVSILAKSKYSSQK